MSKRITVLLADDHALVRETFASWLQSNPDLRVVASVSNADQAVERAVELKPDVILLDIDMPGLHSFEAAKAIKARLPNSRVVFLSAFFNDGYIEQALAVEASGYISKTESPEAVANAIRSVMSGAAYFSAEVQSRIVVDASGTRLLQRGQSRAATLTTREGEMLRYLAQGLPKKNIAQITKLSVKTVERHIANLMDKLDIHDRVELTRFAIREGLVEP